MEITLLMMGYFLLLVVESTASTEPDLNQRPKD